MLECLQVASSTENKIKALDTVLGVFTDPKNGTVFYLYPNIMN